MAIKFDIYEFVLPSWAVTALEYGDYSGLTDEDEALIEEFLIDLPAGGWYDWGEEVDTAWNDMHTGFARCTEVTYYVPVRDNNNNDGDND